MELPVCPTCGENTFTVGRPIRVWQTLEIRLYEDGTYAVEHDEVHDTLDEEAFEEAACAGCATPIPLNTLFPNHNH
jgi:hypothetical protein